MCDYYDKYNDAFDYEDYEYDVELLFECDDSNVDKYKYYE